MNLRNYEGTCAAPCCDGGVLRDMLDHASEAVRLAAGRYRAELESDRMLGLALVRLIEIIGAAASRTPNALKLQYADIPWTRMSGWPQLLNEHYETIDYEFLNDAIRIDLPPLIQQLSCIVGDGLKNGISTSLIQLHPTPSGPACVYAWEYLEHDEAVLTELPIGLRRLIAVQQLDGHVGNAGFRGYFADHTPDDGERVDESVQSGIDALKELGAFEAARIASSALDEWVARLPVWRTALERGDDPDFKSYEDFSWPLDKQWYNQQTAMYSAIDAYMKAHLDEFVHP